MTNLSIWNKPQHPAKACQIRSPFSKSQDVGSTRRRRDMVVALPNVSWVMVAMCSVGVGRRGDLGELSQACHITVWGTRLLVHPLKNYFGFSGVNVTDWLENCTGR